MSVKWITYKGKKILYSDYRGLKETELLENVETVAKILAASPSKALLLLNFENTYLTAEYFARAKELGGVIEPKKEKWAVVGVVGAKNILLERYKLSTGSSGNNRIFKTEAEALEWLIS